MTKELKPCPFCPDGGEPEYRNAGRSVKSLYTHSVYCKKCLCSTYPTQTKQEAISAWNTRYKRTCHVEYPHDARMCSECGYYIGEHHLFCSHCGAEVIDGD